MDEYTLENTIHSNNSVVSIAFNHDCTQVATGNYNNTVVLWNAVTGEQIKTLKGHLAVVSAVAFSKDGNRVVSGSWDKMVNIWNVTALHSLVLCCNLRETTSSKSRWFDFLNPKPSAPAKPMLVIKGHSSVVETVAFNEDGTRLVTGSYDNTVVIWNAITGSRVQTLQGHTEGVMSVEFSPDGKRVVSGSKDTTVIIWNVAQGSKHVHIKGHSNWVRSVAYSKDGTSIVSGSDDNAAVIWNAETGDLVLKLAHPTWVMSVDFSPDGKRVVTGSKDTNVIIWNVSTGHIVQTLKGHSHWVRSVSFSKDGTRIASGSWDNSVSVWALIQLPKLTIKRSVMDDADDVIYGQKYNTGDKVSVVSPDNADNIVVVDETVPNLTIKNTASIKSYMYLTENLKIWINGNQKNFMFNNPFTNESVSIDKVKSYILHIDEDAAMEM